MDIVTVSQKANRTCRQEALRIAELLELPFAERNGHSLPALQEAHGGAAILVIEKDGAALYTGEDKLHRFHLSMAQLRLLRLRRGEKDHLLEAIGREPVTSFLDCTLGLGSDSLIVAYGHPECSQVLGLEGSVPLAWITNEGCRHFVHEDQLVTAALRRIQVMAVRYGDFLQAAPDNSFDIVYFDPMFASPVADSPQFLALRGHLLEGGLEEKDFKEALRVARRRVIIKDRPFGDIFRRIPVHRMEGGKYSRIAYGIYEKG